jgi:hypothetical protein
MTKAYYENDWVRIVYKGQDHDKVFIGMGGVWKPAFRDWNGTGERIVQVRPPQEVRGTIVDVQLKANGTIYNAGKVRIAA